MLGLMEEDLHHLAYARILLAVQDGGTGWYQLVYMSDVLKILLPFLSTGS